MERFTEIITTGNGYLDVGIAAVSAVVAWIGAKFDWWKGQSKPIKVAIAVGVFLFAAFILSLITALFT